MEKKWVLIPDYERLAESQELAAEYGAGFEYNDFFYPSVYEDAKEVQRRIKRYNALNRDTSGDTLHGVFFDIQIASSDSYIRKYSAKRVMESVEIAAALGAQGVVFHSGLLAGLTGEPYINNWVERQEELLRNITEQYPQINIYMENTFEHTPRELLLLCGRLQDVGNFKLCLDYGHAMLTEMPIEEWVSRMASNIGHIHLNDNDLVSDLHQIPGEGKIDFSFFHRLIKQYDVKAKVLLELTGIERQRQALEYMRKL